MALNNFISTIWSARVLENLHKALVYAQPLVANRNYEGEIAQKGDSVKINAIGSVAIGDYVKNTDIASPETLSDAQSVLTITQAKYFNFQIDDVDKAQQNPKVMDAAMNEAAYALANVVDQYVAGSHVDADAGNLVGSDGTPKVVGTGGGEANAYEQLVELGVVLDNNDIPREGRYVIVPPWFEGMLLKDQRFVNFGTPINNDLLLNGLVKRAAGFDILKSNNVPNTAATKYKIIAGHPMAITFAEQVNKVEAYRAEKRFADAIKGLMLYGKKTVRPNGIAVLTANKGT